MAQKINFEDKKIIFDEIKKLENWLDIFGMEEKINELIENKELLCDIETSVVDVDFFRTKKWDSILDFGLYRVTMYVLCRIQKPKIFVETGVLHGLSSNFILAALKKNNFGKLISIDDPSYFDKGPSNQDGCMDTLPPKKEPGWIVLDKYRKNWDLKFGKSSLLLPKVISEYDSFDIFLHDSEHTKKNMSWELDRTWQNIKNGGLVICDNIKNNTAFFDFCNKVNRCPIVFPAGGPSNLLKKKELREEIRFGIIRK